jgi:hypothetical protein
MNRAQTRSKKKKDSSQQATARPRLKANAQKAAAVANGSVANSTNKNQRGNGKKNNKKKNTPANSNS